MTSQGDPSLTPRTRAIGPVSGGERIQIIDVLRGFALFGVLLMNMRDFDLPGQAWVGLFDRIASWLTIGLGDSKFWTLFSFLFGLGFALQMQRAESRGAHFVVLYARRLSALLLFGLLHYVLLYQGDILYDYAVVGFVLLLFRKLRDRIILILALVCFLIPMGQHAVQVRLSEVQRSDPEAARLAAQREAESKREDEEWARVFTRGSYSEVMAYRARIFVGRRISVHNWLFELGGPLPLFLLGLLAGRHRVFQNMREHLPLVRKVLPGTLALGLICTGISITGKWPDPVLPHETPLWRGLLWYLGTPALSFSYACMVTLLAQKGHWQARLTPLAAVGRTALSNYLLQSLVYATVFSHYGLGMVGKIGPSLSLALTFLIYGLQLLLSVWWLRHFRFGPVEWLWRSLTYGSMQSMRPTVRASSGAQA